MGQKNSALKVTARLRLQGDCGSVDCVRLTCRRTTCCCGRRRRLLAAFTFRGEDGPLDAAKVATVEVGRLEKKDGETPVRVTCLAGGTAVLEEEMALDDLLLALKRTTSGRHAALYFCLVGEKQHGDRQAYTALFCNGRRVGNHGTAVTTSTDSVLSKTSSDSEAGFQDALDQVSLDSEDDFKDALDQARLDFRAYFQEALDQISLLSDSDFDYFLGQTSLPPSDDFQDALDEVSLLPEADFQDALDEVSLLPEADFQDTLDQASQLPMADLQEADEVSLNCEADLNVESLEEIALDYLAAMETIDLDSEDDLEEVNLESDDDLEEVNLESDDDLEEVNLDSDNGLEVNQDSEDDLEEVNLAFDDDLEMVNLDSDNDLDEVSQGRARGPGRVAGLLGRVTVLAVLLLYYNYYNS